MGSFLSAAALLILAVAAVGVFHTMVPDHWVPIALLARQRGWNKLQTARAAAGAGVGHTLSTLLIALVVWLGGAVAAARFGHLVDAVASWALVGFGAWIAISSWRELHGAGEAHAHHGHAHEHTHADGTTHRHWHEHHDHDLHESADTATLHEHSHETSSRTALLLILGSSPMLEGIPAFFAAGRMGAVQLAVMAAVFAASTIATYVVLCVGSAAGLQRVNLGPLERYGEIVSGALIALLGAAFLFFPLL